ncbi:MAG TPA: hypothetical protein PKD18_11310 [Saprospiraceae bacterium]|nr:hypothetical protein [Saprospiraceae bacterium]
MRIISDYKDYYDGLQSLGADEKIVYDRNKRNVIVSFPDYFERMANQYLVFGQSSRMRGKKPNEYTKRIYLSNLMIGFCGKLYVGYLFIEMLEDKISSQQVVFNKPDAIAYVRSKENAYYAEELTWRHRFNRRKRRKITWMDCFEERNPMISELNYNDLFHLLGAPVFIYPAYLFSEDKMRSINWHIAKSNLGTEVIVNPNLKELNFQLIVDAYTCYQDIQQYISGVLGNCEDIKNNSTDLEKIRQHGFDEKYGFRTRSKK